MSDASTPQAVSTQTISRRSILISVAATFALAVIVTVAFVMPAEYGVDPLRTGRLFGLSGLAETPSGALTEEPQAMRRDEVAFELQSFESVEYKYDLEEGAAMVFSWSAEAPVYYDMHAEPEDAEPGYAESFAVGTTDHQDGVYVPTFSGIHGWFWENRTYNTVTVRLRTAGFYTGATEFSAMGATPVEIPPAE
jgi:hypothetical protein